MCNACQEDLKYYNLFGVCHGCTVRAYEIPTFFFYVCTACVGLLLLHSFAQVHRQINKQVKATVWMAHDYPLKLKHIMPALEILSVRVRERGAIDSPSVIYFFQTGILVDVVPLPLVIPLNRRQIFLFASEIVGVKYA